MGIPMANIHDPSVAASTTSNRHAADAQTLQDMIKQKDALESELKALGSVLDSHNATMTTSLLTFDGFPRADIDVPQIRTTRARVVALRNDHKALMARIEPALHAHFAAVAPEPTSTEAHAAPAQPASSSAPAPSEPDAEPHTPFARVNTVEENSPAAAAGLQAGDRVTLFGDADWLNHEKLARVARVVSDSRGRSVPVEVLREGHAVRLAVVPRAGWGGRGLLGCHLVPL